MRAVPESGSLLPRRAFVRTLGGVVAGLPLVGCDSGGGDTDSQIPTLTDRPVLTEWAHDIIRVGAPMSELPVAYVSMERRQVFVDQEFRDRASWLLQAHISVSTWHWRIPLPGDPEGIPIAPGDHLREFEELSIREWDPSMLPAMDDIRIRRGRPVRRQLSLDCAELAGVRTVELEGESGDVRPLEAWVQGGPWEVVVSDQTSIDTLREDFRLLGTARRFRSRGCDGAGEAVQIVGWGARPER